ncbi:MAG: CHAP domain-containing protein [Bacilli bacterium]|nr:CHAP domain-containing protein [Bacilli bacterium]
MKKIYIFLLIIFCFMFIGCKTKPEQKHSITFINLDTDSTTININDTDFIPIDYDGIGDFSDLIISTNNDIITLENEVFTGVEGGIAVITISNKEKTIVKEFIVYVNDNINYRKSTLRFNFNTNGLLVGRTLDLGIENMTNVGAKSLDEFEFSVSDNTILEITPDNKIKALKGGQAVVHVRQKKYPSNIGEETIYVGSQATTTTKSGEPEGAPLVLYFDDGNFVIDASVDEQLHIVDAKNLQRYTYKTINEDILIISDTGLFMGVQPGKATVLITSKDSSSNKTNARITVEVTGYRERDYINKILDIALAEEGYKELTGNNDTKYGEWNSCNYEAWCATFVSWCANNAGISKHIIPRSISVSVFKSNFEQMNRFYFKENYTPVPGDLIIFASNGASHIGIVVKSDETTVYTIEGNTSNMVAQRTYPLNYNTITGYCHPDYNMKFNK